MRKLLCTVALAVFMVPFISSVESTAFGQKDKDKKPVAGAATIEVREGEKDGKFRFFVYQNEKLIASGPLSGFASEADARKAIENLKSALGSASIVVKKAKDAPKDKPKDKTTKD